MNHWTTAKGFVNHDLDLDLATSLYMVERQREALEANRHKLLDLVNQLNNVEIHCEELEADRDRLVDLEKSRNEEVMSLREHFSRTEVQLRILQGEYDELRSDHCECGKLEKGRFEEMRLMKTALEEYHRRELKSLQGDHEEELKRLHGDNEEEYHDFWETIEKLGEEVTQLKDEKEMLKEEVVELKEGKTEDEDAEMGSME